MVDQKKKAVPGIPLAALNSIKDQNVRQVLDALTQAHQVRNGASGNGDERFITKAELGPLQNYIGMTANGGVPVSALLPPAQIGRIITDLQSAVIESPLFKELGERIDLIDKPGGIFDRLGATEIALINETTQRKTADEAEIAQREALGARVGSTESAIVEERTARASADNAITQSITTQFASVDYSLSLVRQSVTTVSNRVSSVSNQVDQVQASVNGVSAAVKAESEARVNADGQILAKYTVKIDVNGYVAGYGLMSTANNAVPFSEFIVRADRFAIGSPAGPGITPQVPFIVTTTQSVVGGQIVPPGVYIDTAVIKNGSIGNAKIGNLEVDTLKLAGNAVTVPYTATMYQSFAGNGSYRLVAEGFIDLDFPGMVFATAVAPLAYGTGWRIVDTYMTINGVTVATAGNEEAYVTAVHAGGLRCPAGRIYVRMYFRGQDSGVTLYNPTLFIQGAKK